MTTVNIPAKQNAAVRQGSGDTATAPVTKIDVPQPKPHEILVKINWSGLCASDKSLMHDEWAGFGVTMQASTQGIAGHEGAGVVVAVGDAMHDRWKIGDRAGIKWVASICGVCEFCTNRTDELHCPKQTNSGFSAAGTFQVSGTVLNPRTRNRFCRVGEPYDPPFVPLAALFCGRLVSRAGRGYRNTASPMAVIPRESQMASRTKKRAPSCAAA